MRYAAACLQKQYETTKALSLLSQCSTHDETEEFTLATSRGRNTQDT